MFNTGNHIKNFSKLLIYFENKYKDDAKIKNMIQVLKKGNLFSFYELQIDPDFEVYINGNLHGLHMDIIGSKSELLKLMYEYTKDKKMNDTNVIEITVKDNIIINYVIEYLYDKEIFFCNKHLVITDLIKIFIVCKQLLIDEDDLKKDILDIESYFNSDNPYLIGLFFIETKKRSDQSEIYNFHFDPKCIHDVNDLDNSYDSDDSYNENNDCIFCEKYSYIYNNIIGFEKIHSGSQPAYVIDRAKEQRRFNSIKFFESCKKDIIKDINKIISNYIYYKLNIFFEKNNINKNCLQDYFNKIKIKDDIDENTLYLKLCDITEKINKIQNVINIITKFKLIIDYETYILLNKFYEDDKKLILIAIIDHYSYEFFKKYYEDNKEVLEIIELKYLYFKDKTINLLF